MRWLLLLLAGCSWDRALYLPLPELPETTQSFVLSIERDDQLRVFAVESGQRWDAPVPMAEGRNGLVQLLAYPVKLGALGLEPGEIVPDTGGTRVLDETDATFRTLWNGRSFGPWVPDVRSEQLQDFRIPSRADEPCTKFRAKTIPLEGRPHAASMVDHERAWMVRAGDGELVELGRSGFVRRLGSGPYVDIATDRQGTTWLVAPTEIQRVDVTGSLAPVEVVPAPSGSIIDALALRTGEELEMIAALDDLRVERYQQGAWFTLFRLPEQEGSCTNCLHALFPSTAPPIVFDDRANRLYQFGIERVEWALDSAVTSAAFSESTGLYAATEAGALYHATSGRLEDLEEIATLLEGGATLRPRALLPFRDGVLFAGRTGFVGQYRQSHGLCPAQQMVDAPITDMVMAGRSAFLLNQTEQLPNLTVIEPADEAFTAAEPSVFDASDGFLVTPEWSYLAEDGRPLMRLQLEVNEACPSEVLYLDTDPNVDDFWTILWKGGGHPATFQGTVLRWTAPTAGRAEIGGMISDACVENGGDGARMTVRHGGSILFTYPIPDNAQPVGGCRCDEPPPSVALNETVIVDAGETLDFVLYSGGRDNSFDTATFAPRVTLHPF